MSRSERIKMRSSQMQQQNGNMFKPIQLRKSTKLALKTNIARESQKHSHAFQNKKSEKQDRETTLALRTLANKITKGHKAYKQDIKFKNFKQNQSPEALTALTNSPQVTTLANQLLGYSYSSVELLQEAKHVLDEVQKLIVKTDKQGKAIRDKNGNPVSAINDNGIISKKLTAARQAEQDAQQAERT
jgi:hypothetical protein